MENENLEVMETGSIETQNENEEESPIEIATRMVDLSDKGCQITSENVALNILFKNINNSVKNELVPAIEKISDFEELNDELKNAGDILIKTINWADAGFRLTDIPDDSNEEFSEEHLLFSEILMLSDMELRQYIPTPISE